MEGLGLVGEGEVWGRGGGSRREGRGRELSKGRGGRGGEG